MRVFLEVGRCEFRRYATYRAATVAGVFTNTVWAFIKAYIFLAVWDARGEIGGYDAVDAVTFAFLCQALVAPLSMFGLGLDLPQRIRTGDVTVDLLRPVDFQGWWFAADLGRSFFQLVGRAFPFLVGALFFSVRVPGSVAQWALFALSLLLAFTVSFAIRYVVSLSVWWIMDSRGLETTMTLLMLFFSGMVVPLVMLPGLLGDLAGALPWAAVLQVPADIFLGQSTGAGALGALAFQACWALVLLGAGRLMTARVRTAVVVQGG
ncbi:ABC transporter permease [Streptomyces sp. URMC 123]|uniref:ABC transporter permease n=1 Tax=Streptomyces sp. URMC 123 TaxID=3423403 RepID=UPI003F19E890